MLSEQLETVRKDINDHSVQLKKFETEISEVKKSQKKAAE